MSEPKEDEKLDEKLDAILKRLESLPEVKKLEELKTSIRFLHIQRWAFLTIIGLFSIITFIWMMVLSCSLSDSTWKQMVGSLSPAFLWLGFVAVALRWVKVMR